MNVCVKLFGVVFLLVAGLGLGDGVCRPLFSCWWQLHTLSRLFIYLDGLLAYQQLTGRELLRRAAQDPDFRRLGIEDCKKLTDIPVPCRAGEALCSELQQELSHMSGQPHTVVCTSFQRMARLCEEAAEQKRRQAEAARRLWPRLGICAGALVAILVW